MMFSQRHLPLALLLMAVASGCSWFGGGGDDDDEVEIKPNPLPKFSREVKLDVVWSRKIGSGADDRAIRLRPAIYGGRVFAASADGHVKALEKDSGRVIWTVEVKRIIGEKSLASGFTKDLDTIIGGVGAGGDLVVVGTGAGEIVALNQSDGSLAWRTGTSSEVLAPPQIEGDLVVVQTIDGKIAAYDAIDGERQWLYTTSIPALTLRGTATPLIVDDFVVSAFASGRVVFIDKETGVAAFERRVAVSQGISDLERLVDIDGAMTLIGDRVYLASFQGRLVSIDMTSGEILWAEDASSIVGVSHGFGNVYLATEDSQIAAYNADNGRDGWNVDALLHRDITAPVTLGSYVATTDFEGHIHLLAQSDGRFVGRRKFDTVKAGLVVEDGRLYAMGDKGSLAVLEIK